MPSLARTVAAALLATSLVGAKLRAQFGEVDPSFDSNPGADSAVHLLARESNGRWVIAGAFSSYDGVQRNRVARVLPDGSNDDSFDPGAGPNARVWSLALQGNGQVLIGGEFTSVDGAPRAGVARLDTDGRLDPSFTPPTSLYGSTRAVAIQTNGRVLVGGDFNSMGGSAHYLARLTTSGALDPSFRAQLNGRVTHLALQPDGRILAAGTFQQAGGLQRRFLVRLRASGAVDTTFDPGAGPEMPVRAMVLQRDGRIVIGGGFTLVNGVSRRRLARLKSDGSVDLSFDAGSSSWGSIQPEILTAAVEPSGAIMVGGDFLTFAGVPRVRVARVLPDGALDPAFDPGAGTTSYVGAIGLEPDGRAVLGGVFLSYDGEPRGCFARIFAYDAGPRTYCTSGLSSLGCTPAIASIGAPRVGASSGFTIEAVGVNGQSQGLVLYGLSGRAATPWAVGSTSLLCVRPPLQRTGLQDSAGSAGQCDGVLALDWLTFAGGHPGALGAPATAGVTVQAQAWYRDAGAIGRVSTSDALEFLTVP